MTIVKSPSYKNAVQWIADNDNDVDLDAELIQGYITTALVADLFGVSVEAVAADIARRRVKDQKAAAAAAKKSLDQILDREPAKYNLYRFHSADSGPSIMSQHLTLEAARKALRYNFKDLVQWISGPYNVYRDGKDRIEITWTDLPWSVPTPHTTKIAYYIEKIKTTEKEN